MKVKEVMVWSGLKHLGAGYIGQPLVAGGGFGADFTQNSLLAQFHPDLLHLSTTNGAHCTGDAIKMGEAIEEKPIDVEWVQPHRISEARRCKVPFCWEVGTT